MTESTAQDVQPEQESPEALPPLTAEQIKEIIQGNLALQEALDQDPTVMTELETVIHEHTRKGITPTTGGAIYQGLELYLDTESVEYLLGVLALSDDPRYIEQAKAHAAPQTWSWLRRLLALYGSDLREATALSGVNVNAWRTVNRRAYYDAVSGRWGATLEIIKYNGERLFLDETLGSALILAQGIVDTLNSMPPEVAPEVIDRETIKAFIEQCLVFGDLYAPGMYEEWAEAESEVAEGPAGDQGSVRPS